MNLVSEEASGAKLWYSSTVRVALAYKAEQEAKIAAEKAEKEAKKTHTTENKRRKEEEAQERAVQRQVGKDLKAMAAADKLAQREAKKRQLELPKKGRKKSLIVVLLYKKTSNYSTKVVTFVEEGNIVIEGEGSETAQTQTRKINLPM